MHTKIAAGYDAVAHEYAARLFRELDGKPFDREFLDRLERSAPLGPFLDLGCGPGHIAKFIAERGRTVIGVDLSPAMVAIARNLTPEVEFRQGDMCSLNLPDSCFAGVIAFYSIIHLGRDELNLVALEISRILAPGGRAALAFHVGDEIRHVESLWGVKTDLDFNFLQPAAVEATLERAGLKVIQSTTRPPYAPEVESQTTRHYSVVQRPPRDA